MNDHITDEFTCLVSHPSIQVMIEPKVGMIFLSKEGWEDVIVRIYEKRKSFDLGVAGEGFYKKDGILVPPLEWLIERLKHYGRTMVDCKYLTDQYMATVWMFGKKETVIEFGETSRLACIKALHEVMRVEEG